MSTARRPVRFSGVVRPICQSQRIGRGLAAPCLDARCGGYQHGCPARGWQASGAGSGTTRQPNRISVDPARFAVRTLTWCGPTASFPV